jgi:hypothetical protein
METEGSLPHSQQLSTCSRPEPDQSSPQIVIVVVVVIIVMMEVVVVVVVVVVIVVAFVVVVVIAAVVVVGSSGSDTTTSSSSSSSAGGSICSSSTLESEKVKLYPCSRRCPEDCETSRPPHFLHNRLTDGGGNASLTLWPPFTP